MAKTLSEIKEVAKRYDTRTAFKVGSPGAYKEASRKGWIDKLNLPAKRFVKWTKDAVLIESRKYSCRSEFKAMSKQAYRAALRNDWLKLMDFPERKLKWSPEAIVLESQKYTNRTEFQDGSPGAYHRASQTDSLKDLPLPMRESKWTFERVFQEAQKFESRYDFRCSFPGAYNAALLNGWIDLLRLPKVTRVPRKQRLCSHLEQSNLGTKVTAIRGSVEKMIIFYKWCPTCGRLWKERSREITTH